MSNRTPEEIESDRETEYAQEADLARLEAAHDDFPYGETEIDDREREAWAREDDAAAAREAKVRAAEVQVAKGFKAIEDFLDKLSDGPRREWRD